MNNISDDSKAIVLLCSNACAARGEKLSVLSPLRYAQLAAQLYAQQLTPKDLLTMSAADIKARFSFSRDRLNIPQLIPELLSRAGKLPFVLQLLSEQGIGIMTRADPEFPRGLKRKLGQECPALFFYSGNIELLKTRMVGIVGSRNASPDGVKFAARYAAECVRLEHLTVAAGGAKGIDYIAEVNALNSGGCAVSLIADSLKDRLSRKEIISALSGGRYLVMSAFGLDSPFSVGSAMARNHYVYALSDAVLVAESATDGGTWTGACDNAKKGYTRLLIRDCDAPGNREMLNRGYGIAVTDADLQSGNLKIREKPAAEAVAGTQPVLKAGNSSATPAPADPATAQLVPDDVSFLREDTEKQPESVQANMQAAAEPEIKPEPEPIQKKEISSENAAPVKFTAESQADPVLRPQPEPQDENISKTQVLVDLAAAQAEDAASVRETAVKQPESLIAGTQIAPDPEIKNEPEPLPEKEGETAAAVPVKITAEPPKEAAGTSVKTVQGAAPSGGDSKKLAIVLKYCDPSGNAVSVPFEIRQIKTVNKTVPDKKEFEISSFSDLCNYLLFDAKFYLYKGNSTETLINPYAKRKGAKAFSCEELFRYVKEHDGAYLIKCKMAKADYTNKLSRIDPSDIFNA
jgi:predicted Rossmann fold nucleotide-binding protein DprA/Smf involved in DNA uptake